MSERQINKIIQQITKISFSDYLEKCRIAKAEELLRVRPDVTIESIALQVGYASDKSFRRAFKRVMGILPSELRQ